MKEPPPAQPATGRAAERAEEKKRKEAAARLMEEQTRMLTRIFQQKMKEADAAAQAMKGAMDKQHRKELLMLKVQLRAQAALRSSSPAQPTPSCQNLYS